MRLSPPEGSEVRIRQEGRISSPKALDNYLSQRQTFQWGLWEIYLLWAEFRVEMVIEGVEI